MGELVREMQLIADEDPEALGNEFSTELRDDENSAQYDARLKYWQTYQVMVKELDRRESSYREKPVPPV